MKASSFFSIGFRFVSWIFLVTLLCLPGSGVDAAPIAFDIQAAIDGAPDGGTVTIPSGTYTVSLVVPKNLTLVGQPDLSVTIQAEANKRVISVDNGKSLTIRDLNLTNGAGVSEGGAVRVFDGSLTIEHCHLYNNHADYGGAVYHGGTGQVTVRNYSYIYNNQAYVDGGGIYANGNLDINSSWMDTDVANRNGGAATVWTGSLTVVGGAISFNQAGGNGGAFNVNNSVYVDQVVFTSNTAGADGGAILQWNGDNGLSVTIQSSTFDLNKAGSTGGALSVAQGAATTITHSTFKSNQVDTGNSNEPKGGAVFFSDASRGHTLTISDTTFISNSLNCMGCPNYFGGGLYAVTSLTGKVILDQDMFRQNKGWIGGGVYADRALITRSTFQGNTGGSGAAVYLTGASQVKGSAFYQNSGTNGGSGLSVTSAATSLSVEDSKFIGNSTPYDLAGAMILGAQSITLKNVAVVDTQVGTGGSAILLNYSNSIISLYHVTVNDTHLNTGARTGIYGIHLKGPTVVNIFNSMLTNHGTGLKIYSGSACSLYNTLWYGNTTDIDGAVLSYANYYPVYSDPAYAVDRHHLTPASGAIDQGVDRMVYTDLDGDLRDSQPDLGADEYRAHLYLPLVVRQSRLQSH